MMIIIFLIIKIANDMMIFKFRFDCLEVNNLFDNIFLDQSHISRISKDANSIGLKLEAKICISEANIGIPGIRILKKSNDSVVQSKFCSSDDDNEYHSDDMDSNWDSDDDATSKEEKDDYKLSLKIEKVMKRLKNQIDFLATLNGPEIIIASDGIFQNVSMKGRKKEQWCIKIMDKIKSDKYFENAIF